MLKVPGNLADTTENKYEKLYKSYPIGTIRRPKNIYSP